MIRLAPIVLASAALASLAGAARAQLMGPPLPDVDWAQNLGAQVPLEARLVGSDGAPVTLEALVGERPVVLALVYYECPMLCNLVLSGLVSSLKGTTYDVGDEFDVVVLSIDPDETPELARANRDGWVERYGRGDGSGWSFLVGEEPELRAVADAIGFRYSYVPETDEFAHPAGIAVLTPDGVVSRILYGTEFAPRDLQFSVIEASEGAVGSPLEKFILRCFHYDPTTGRYGFAILAALRTLGIATVVCVAGFVLLSLRRERRRRRQALQAS